MIDMKEVIRNPQAMRDNIAARNLKDVDVDAAIESYQLFQIHKKSFEDFQAAANQISDQIKVERDSENRAKLIGVAKQAKREADLARDMLKSAKEHCEQICSRLPNWMATEVPTGSDDADNKEVSRFGNPTSFDFKPQDHVSLGESRGLIDFDSGTKVAGPKFYFLKNQAVLLQHAIKSYAFRKAMEAGFTPLHTPDIAKNSILQGVGFSPRGDESNTYELADLDMSLVATAEIAVCGMHAEEVIPYKDLPLLYVAESHCFRREAGTAGRSSKGLYRVHQFDKVELFAFSTPEQSAAIHQVILELEKSIYQDLGIPYRVVLNCSGDLGNPAFKKFDIEAWMPGKGEIGEYGEVTSASNCTDYQARRSNTRFNDPFTGRNTFVHTLNGTAVALSRVLITIMENYQTKEGGIRMPKVLVPYLGFDYIAPLPEPPTRFSRNAIHLRGMHTEP